MIASFEYDDNNMMRGIKLEKNTCQEYDLSIKHEDSDTNEVVEFENLEEMQNIYKKLNMQLLKRIKHHHILFFYCYRSKYCMPNSILEIFLYYLLYPDVIVWLTSNRLFLFRFVVQIHH
jgi:chlorite dismutase